MKPNFTDAWNNIASALVQKGLIPQAIDCYVAALRINPHLVRPPGLLSTTSGILCALHGEGQTLHVPRGVWSRSCLRVWGLYEIYGNKS